MIEQRIGKIWKEAIIAIEILPWHLPGGAEENV
jgi:hypothetical protein